MARAKTGPFYITEPVTMSSTTSNVTTTLDLGAYVDPADKQGIMITNVDFIFQDKDTFLPVNFASDTRVKVEVHDAVIGDLCGANNYHLIASCGLTADGAAGLYSQTDLWPDRFGIGKDEGRIVVNDELEISGESTVSVSGLQCIVKLTCKVVTLTQKDFMSLALQTVAN